MSLISEIKACRFCEDELPLEPRPILQFHRKSQFLIVGQAPGIKAHTTRTPWNDASGVRLRDWLQISSTDFYHSKIFTIIPMGFCYPGKGSSGDLPPRKECSVLWMDSILENLKDLKKIILVGSYSTKYFLGEGNFSEQIKEHAQNDSHFILLPHPSPRNNIWLRKNSWFEEEYLSKIRQKFKSSSF